MSSNSRIDESARLEDQLTQAALSTEQEERRLTQEADRLSVKAQRLREKSELAERQSKRLRRQAVESNRLHTSLKFEGLCRGLSRNASSITEISNTKDFPRGYAESLGHALEENTHVSSLTIHLDNSHPFADDDDAYTKDNVTKHVSPLVHHVETSGVLRSVTVARSGITDFDDGLEDSFMAACFRNQHLQHLKVNGCNNIPASLFLQSAQLSKSLQTLHLEISDEYSHRQRQTIGQGFSRFRSLKRLRLVLSNHFLVESILIGLRDGRVQLEELKLTCQDYDNDANGLWLAFSALLVATTLLKHLFLSWFKFERQSMQLLIDGLTRGNGISIASVSKLALDNCDFDRDARRLLRDLMHTPSEEKSPLEVLEIDRGDNSPHDLSAADLVSILCVQKDISHPVDLYCPTIGSQIKSLFVGPVEGGLPGFLSLLADNASRIVGLTTLSVDALNQDDSDGLTRCISVLPSLRELNVKELDGSFRPIIMALKENGHIQSVSLDTTNENDLKLAKAYCERNQFLDGLLLESTRSVSLDERDGEIAVDEHDGTSTNKSASFGPTLLQTSNQIPSSRASAMLGSFVRLRASIGYP